MSRKHRCLHNVTINPVYIMQQDNMVVINAILSIDLFSRCCSEAQGLMGKIVTTPLVGEDDLGGFDVFESDLWYITQITQRIL